MRFGWEITSKLHAFTATNGDAVYMDVHPNLQHHCLGLICINTPMYLEDRTGSRNNRQAPEKRSRHLLLEQPVIEILQIVRHHHLERYQSVESGGTGVN